MPRSHFDVLGLPVDASYTQLDEAYRLLKARHAGAPERLAELELAYRTLSNPINRKRHLQELRAAGHLDASNDNTAPSSAESSARASASSAHTPTGFEPGDSATAMDRPRSQNSGRAQTEFFDARSQQEPPPRSDRPEGHAGSRQHTEFYSPPEVSQPGNPPNDPAHASRPSHERAARQHTEFYSPPEVSQPGSPPHDPAHAAPRPTHERPGRQHTEFLDAGVRPPDLLPPLQEEASSGPNERASRSPTEYLDLTRDAGPDATSARPATGLNERNATSSAPQPAPAVQVTYRNRVLYFQLQSGDNLVGRPPRQGPAPAISLEDPAQFISRHHAIIRVVGHAYTIIDQGSDNGTHLNGRRLQPREPYPLKPEDVITIEGRELRIVEH